MHLRAPNMAKKKYGRCLSDVCLMGGGRAELRAQLCSRRKQETSASREILSLSSYRRRYVRGMNRRFGRHIGIPTIVQGSGPSRGQSPVEWDKFHPYDRQKDFQKTKACQRALQACQKDLQGYQRAL